MAKQRKRTDDKTCADAQGSPSKRAGGRHVGKHTRQKGGLQDGNQPFPLALGRAILELRAQAGLTAKEVGEKISRSEDAVLKWEKGKTSPNVKELPDVAAALGVPLSQLMAASAGETTDYDEVSRSAFREARAEVEAALGEMRQRAAQLRARLDELAGLEHRADELAPLRELMSAPALELGAEDLYISGDVAAADGTRTAEHEYAEPVSIEMGRRLKLVRVTGDSARDWAWPGQIVAFDATPGQTVPGGWLCLVVTREGSYIKRKNGPGRYESINRDYPDLEVVSEDLLAEFWAVFVLPREIIIGREMPQTQDEAPAV